jgi:hypothetical protein
LRDEEQRRRSGREWQAPLEDQFQSVDLVDLLADMSEPERADGAREGALCGLTEATQVRARPVAHAQSSSARIPSRAYPFRRSDATMS